MLVLSRGGASLSLVNLIRRFLLKNSAFCSLSYYLSIVYLTKYNDDDDDGDHDDD